MSTYVINNTYTRLNIFSYKAIGFYTNKTPTQALTPPAEKKNRQNRHVLCNCSGRGEHKIGYNIYIISELFSVTSLNIKLYICNEKLTLL